MTKSSFSEQNRISATNTRKNVKRTICFFPLSVLNAFGGILNESDREGIARLIHQVNKEHFVPPNWAAQSRKAYWYQRIAIALWAGNACKVAPFLKNCGETRC